MLFETTILTAQQYLDIKILCSFVAFCYAVIQVYLALASRVKYRIIIGYPNLILCYLKIALGPLVTPESLLKMVQSTRDLRRKR
jgi:hypothetical protein